jgi:predicted nicotinamide N-methyase
VTLEAMLRFIRERTSIGVVPLVPQLRMYQAGELTPLWHATAAELAHTDPAPFWAFPWVGGQALARYVCDHPELVRGRTVLDLGTGSGLVAIAAAASGAREVVACDLDPFCAAAVQLNAGLNGVTVRFELHDFLAVAPGDAPLTGFDVVLAGDLFYENALAAGVLPRLAACAARGARALVGDPGRTYSPGAGLAELARYDVPTSPEVESAASLRTRVLEVLAT